MEATIPQQIPKRADLEGICSYLQEVANNKLNVQQPSLSSPPILHYFVVFSYSHLLLPLSVQQPEAIVFDHQMCSLLTENVVSLLLKPSSQQVPGAGCCGET